MHEWVDISVTLRNGMPGWPGDQPFEIRREIDMASGAELNLSSMRTSVHIGTHMDAPLHFVDRGQAIDRIPLDAVIGRARVIRIGNERVIPVAELERAGIVEGERLLFRTANSDRCWAASEFQRDFVAIEEDAARWLALRKPKLIGVDYLSVAPFADGGPSHRALLGAGIWIVEGLNLSVIEPGGYDLVCLPLKIEGADGAPARAALRRVSP